MQIISNGLINEQDGVMKETSFGIKKENMSIVFSILRGQLYSDEIRAVVRETSSNSFDSHIASGKAGVPIQVTLPTQLEPKFKVRDFGAGLTDEEVLDIYTSYGYSTKRDDNRQNGVFGVGSKSPFSYSDSFLVTSYKDGIASVFNAYLDPSDEGKMALVAKTPTDEPNGIEVVVPVRTQDIGKFRSKAVQVYPYFDTLPNITNIEEDERTQIESIRNAPAIFEGEGWKCVGGDKSLVVMCNVSYPLSSAAFTENEIGDEAKELLDGGLILKLKNGEVEFSASREQIKYSPRTKKCLLEKIQAIHVDLVKQCSGSFTGCSSLWDAKILYKKVFDFTNPLYRLRNLFIDSLTFKGHRVNEDAFKLMLKGGNETDITCYKYGKDEYSYKNRNKIKRTQTYAIKADAKHLVVVNDTKICNGILNRIVGKIETDGYTKVYVLSFASDTIRDQWKAESGFDGPMVSLSSLPKEPLSKYYPSGSPGGVKNEKHSSKEFTYNGDNKGRYDNQRTEFWDVAEVDLTNDEGVYLTIERFHYLDKFGCPKHPNELKDILTKLDAIGIEVPIIYGFKKSSAEKVKSNRNMVSFWTWLCKEVHAYMDSHPELAQKLANKEYLVSLDANHRHMSHFFKIVSKWVLAGHCLSDFAAKIEQLYLDDASISSLRYLLEVASYTNTAKPSYDIEPDYKKLMAKYPLLFQIVAYHGNYILDSWKESLEDYIKMADKIKL